MYDHPQIGSAEDIGGGGGAGEGEEGMMDVIETLIGIGTVIAILILFAVAMFGFYYSINGMARCLSKKETQTTSSDAGGVK